MMNQREYEEDMTFCYNNIVYLLSASCGHYDCGVCKYKINGNSCLKGKIKECLHISLSDGFIDTVEDLEYIMNAVKESVEYACHCDGAFCHGKTCKFNPSGLMSGCTRIAIRAMYKDLKDKI